MVKNSTINLSEQMKGIDTDMLMRKGLSNLFGEKVSKGTPLINVIIKLGSRHLAERGGVPVNRMVESFYYNRNPNNPEFAAKMGNRAEKLWRTAIPFLPDVYTGGKRVLKDVSYYGDINEGFSRVLNATNPTNYGYFTMFRSDLEVIQNLRKEVSRKTKNSIKGCLVDLLGSVPNAISARLDGYIDYLDPSKRKKKKGNRAVKEYTVLHEKIEEKSNQANAYFDSWLTKLETEDSRDKRAAAIEKNNKRIPNREYPFLVNTVLDIADVDAKSLDDKGKRVEVIKRVKGYVFNEIFLGLFLSGVEKVKGLIRYKGDDEFSKPTAGKMILALEAELRKNPGLVRVSLPGVDDKDVRLEDYIESIFRQHLEDSGRSAVPVSLEDDLKEACSLIAEAMKDPNRRLMPQSLALLVDRKSGILTIKNGKVNEVESGEALVHRLHTLMDENNLTFRKKQKEQDYYREKLFTKDEFLECWNVLTEEEKFVWSTFFPDTVLKGAGVTEEELDSLRCHGNDLWKEVFAATFEEVRKFSRNDLKEMGYSSSQIGEIETLVKNAKDFMKGNADPLEKNREKAFEWTARMTVRMGPDRVQSALQEALKRKKALDEIKAKEASKSFSERYAEEKESSKSEKEDVGSRSKA